MRRRDFLGGLTAAGAVAGGLGCTGRGLSGLPPALRRRAGALLWGEPDANATAGQLPVAHRPDGMLEVFLLGGMSAWESFYLVPEFGRPQGETPGSQFWAFDDFGPVPLPRYMERCGTAGAPLWTPFAADANGVTVNLGPFARALQDRPDMLARMRIWVLRHELEPHEAGIPLALTGQSRGSPRLAAFGSHVQRYFQDHAAVPRAVPWAYTIFQSTFAVNNNGDVATAIGLHPGSARPLAIHLGTDSQLTAQLARPRTAGHTAALDDLVSLYRQRFGGRLVDARGRPLRSPAYQAYAAARSAIRQHGALEAILTPEVLAVGSADVCHSEKAETRVFGEIADEVTAGMGLARHLLTAPGAAAKYVQLIDGGIYSDPDGQGYDSHAFHVERQAINMDRVLTALSGVINRPGEADPSKLDLDRHFVLLNTEFGRSPDPEYSIRNPQGTGTNHWPWGYVVVGFGGFVGADRQGVVGAIGPDGRATRWFTPAEHRAALLLALGIWPFTAEAFAVGDVRDATTELDAAAWLKEGVLGYAT